MNRDSELLNKWTLNASVPASFNSTVWRRIEDRRGASIGGALRHWLNVSFARPVVAIGYLSVTLAVGLAAAQIQSSRILRERNADLEARYVQSIDPYAKAVTK